jgi:hypothetical protein
MSINLGLKPSLMKGDIEVVQVVDGKITIFFNFALFASLRFIAMRVFAVEPLDTKTEYLTFTYSANSFSIFLTYLCCVQKLFLFKTNSESFILSRKVKLELFKGQLKLLI